MQVTRTEVDGVPTFWAEGPGNLVASLVFRVGMADEPLLWRGTSHLVEHLALGALGTPHLPHNGMVDATTTTFVASGSAEEVAEFLTGSVRALHALPYDRLDTERRILDAEAAQRGGSAMGTALSIRYGWRHHGLVTAPELGMRTVTPADIERWRTAWFTRGNAVLWLSGPPPAGLDLSALPDGPRQPPPTPEPLPDQRFPCWYPGAPNGLLVLLPVPRSTAASTAVAVTGQRLLQRLRHEEGRSYGVQSDYQPVTAHHAHALLAADCQPDHAAEVRDACVAELSRLALQGPALEDLDAFRAQAHRAGNDPARHVAHARRLAENELVGHETMLFEDFVAELDALTPTDLVAPLADALRQAVWVVPQHVGMTDRRVHEVVTFSSSAVGGSSWSRTAPAHHEVPDRLVVGAEGVSLVWPDQRCVTVRWGGAAAVQHWTDGGRTLWGADGFILTLRPFEWAGGPAAVQAIDHFTPPGLAVVMDGELGTVDVPPPDSPPGGAPRTNRPAGSGAGAGPLALVVDVVLGVLAVVFGLFALVYLALAATVDEDAVGMFVAAVVTGAMSTVFALGVRQRRRQRAGPAPAPEPPAPRPSERSGFRPPPGGPLS